MASLARGLRAIALYASTSGSTRLLVEGLAYDAFSSLTITDIERCDSFPSLINFDLVIVATPTYGQGDAHHAWREWGPEIFRTMPSGKAMAMIALGDSRGHPRTFAGGLRALREISEFASPVLFGAVPASDYVFERSDSVSDGMFPGLVLEYRRNRVAAERIAKGWLRNIVKQVDAYSRLEK